MSSLARTLQTVVLDWRIGWNEAAKERHLDAADDHDEREQRARAQYAALNPSPWSALVSASASNTRSVALGEADDVGGAQNGAEQPCRCIAAGAGGTHWPSDHNKRNETTTNPAPNVAGSDEGEGMA